VNTDIAQDTALRIPAQWVRWALEAGGDPFSIERARRTALRLMSVYGLSEWKVRIGGANELGGSVTSSVDRTRLFSKPGVLTLSGPLMSLWDESQREQLIRHEIAHALSGPLHDHRWVAACHRVGARPERCWGKDGEAKIPGDWHGTCPGGHRHKPRQRKPRVNYSCSTCHPGEFDPRYVVTWAKKDST
jgi:hypothetical protein